ncbi:MAG: hypothetical protein QW096_09525 [Thermofilaceae archaeon]
MSDAFRVIVFSRKKLGKIHKHYTDCIKIYLSYPIKNIKPFFEARIGRDVVKMALEHFKVGYDDKGDYLVLYGDGLDEKFRRIIVFSGVRQVVDGSLGKKVLEVVDSMGELELLFWYSRFINAYDRGSYWDVYRVAKSIRILYRI